MADARVRAVSASYVFVGSGVAGTLMAQLCAAGGNTGILVLEAGPAIPMGDPGWWFHNVATGGGTSVAPYAACYDLASDFTATGLNPWDIVGGRIFGTGGSTLHWGGWAPRFMPEDFALYTNTGQGIDWPYTYNDLEPYYCLAEKYLGVSGDSSDNDPPRSAPFPYGPAPYPISAGPFITAFEQLSISYGHMPVARYGQANGNVGPCRTTGTCDYCPVAGRFTGDQPLAQLVATPGVTLVTSAAVSSINMSSKQVATGVTYTDLTTGDTVQVTAQAVFLCNGAFEAPKLLQASTSSYWPNGIGNDNDLVGRYMCATQFFYASGQMGNPQGFEEELGFPSLYSRAYDTPAEQAGGKLFISMNYETPNIDIGLMMAQGNSAAAIMAARTAASSFQLYGNLSAFPQYNNRVTVDTSGTTRFGLPRTALSTPDPLYDPTVAQNYMNVLEKVLTTMGCTNLGSGTYPQRGDHVACTTRMATDATQGVVDPGMLVHGTENVYVVGNSVMPTLPAANPTLTLVAMIYKLVGEATTPLGRLLAGKAHAA